tara:strand:- start:18571 stop:19218 length:648 start_codon:yes stop_codon:yes gene_type:complete
MADLQNKPVIVGFPIEIERAVNQVRIQLAKLEWIDHPYFIAQRFFRKDPSSGRLFIYPETYAPEKPGGRTYKRLTPDNDFKGMFFFMVGDGTTEFNANEYNFITFPVSIIFSVNLQLISEAKLNRGLFTQELIRDARRVLTDQMMNFDFQYDIINETRDIQRCFREFRMDELEQYNRAPMQCFRIDLSFKIREDCGLVVPENLGLYESGYIETYQ